MTDSFSFSRESETFLLSLFFLKFITISVTLVGIRFPVLIKKGMSFHLSLSIKSLQEKYVSVLELFDTPSHDL